MMQGHQFRRHNQTNRERETIQSEPSRQVVQNGKSDYSRESSQGRRQMERTTAQMNSASRIRQHDGQLNSGMEAMPGIQRRSNYS